MRISSEPNKSEKENGGMLLVRRTAAVVGAAVALAALSGGCSGNSNPRTATPGTSAASSAGTPNSAQPIDYTKLLIKPTDIEAPMTFTATPPVVNPNGQPGA